MKIQVKHLDDDGAEVEVDLPAKHEVCPTCEGSGFVLAGGMRGAVYTAEEFAESFDEEEAEEYFRPGGRYDEPCDQCHGKNVIKVIDHDHLTEDEKSQYELYQAWKDEQDQIDYADAMTERGERMMGC